MLSYRHHYHAGNFADLLKHALLTWVVDSLQQKGAGLVCYETHAGAGLYPLSMDGQGRRAEHLDGISRIWPWLMAEEAASEELLAPYRRLLLAANPDGELRLYPGSPWLLREQLRDQDRLILMELHSTDYGQLRGYLAGDKRVALHQRDGHEGVVALLPPSTGRGLILIDPSYERKGEYRQVVESLCAMRHRWSNALVMIWYPLLPGAPQRVLLDGLVERAGAPVYRLELEVAMPGSRGMYGCGLAIVRPPWRLPQRWPQLVQSLAERLSPNGRSRCEWLVSEEMLSG